MLCQGLVWTKDKKQIKRPWKRNRKQSVITKSRLEVIKIERFEDTPDTPICHGKENVVSVDFP